MASTTATPPQTGLPTGTWRIDHIHSTAGFAVKHMVGTFRGRFENFDVTLSAGPQGDRLTGTVSVDSIVVKDDNLAAHLRSPEFFDTERYPELSFVADSIRRQGDHVIVDGQLTIKDQTHPVEARGTITGPAEGPGGLRLGLTLEAVVDRNEFGLEWNAPLPGGGLVLGNDVTLIVELELSQADGNEA